MLTKLDCYYHTEGLGGDERNPCSFVILNPIKQPGTLVAACSLGTQGSIGSQVACKLAIEHFVGGVLDQFSEAHSQAQSSELATHVLEAAFRKANSSVYSFGHKLAAGGRMGASLIGLVITQNFVAGGRAGPGSVYLMRRGEVFPFFAAKPQAPLDALQQEQLVGAHSLVSVELASVPLEHSDRIFLFSSVLDNPAERRLCVVSASEPPDGDNPASYISRRITSDSSKILFSLQVDIGPNAIYLDKAVG